MFCLMLASFLPVSCFHLGSISPLGDTVSIRLVCLNILFYEFIEDQRICSFVGDRKPLNPGLGRSLYKSPLHDMLPSTDCFSQKKKNC